MNFRVVIPARLASTRLPRKVLRPIAGRPMLEHVYRAGVASGAEAVIIATDSEEVAGAARAFGAEVCMTAETHLSGTDRVNEVAQRKHWPAEALVVNLQGDEPLLPPTLIAQAARELSKHPDAEISTLCAAISSQAEWRDPNAVKVVRDDAGYALYFSRAPIPWDREGHARGAPQPPAGACWRHIGLYAYRVGALARFSKLPPARLEQVEVLEQLRAQANGMKIYVGIAAERPGLGVDTEEDLHRVEAALARQ
jgi:3-deoxy-manno-octulosonate cytidylyltransferase (CMP-KDO synthetase)